MTSLPHVTGHRVISELLTLLDATDLTQAMLQPEAVHRIRVAIKKVRAWLKLCRSVSGESDADRQLTARLRDLSTALAGQRDREVARLTLAKLARKYPGKKARLLIEEVSRSLSEKPVEASVVLVASDQIHGLRQDLSPFSQRMIPLETARDAINQTYAKMCQRGKLALKTKQCEELHAWRKQVKTLGYQLAVANSHQDRPAKLHAKIAKLGNKLGKVHDLCFLQAMLVSLVEEGRCHEELKPLYKRIEQERDGLLRGIRKQYGFICRHAATIL